MNLKYYEKHRIEQVGWLRAAVLGANDGIISTASLIIGVAAAQTSHSGILIAGVAGAIAGALSMAAGEYISVSSQADAEKSELKREKMELETAYSDEVLELTNIYIKRGLEPDLAKEVAIQLMAKDALGAHARDELGITETFSARPLQAAISSAWSFTLGSLLPLVIIFFVSREYLIPTVAIMSIFFLALLGAAAAKVGRSSIVVGASRVVIWGTIAMVISVGIGRLLGVAI